MQFLYNFPNKIIPLPIEYNFIYRFNSNVDEHLNEKIWLGPCNSGTSYTNKFNAQIRHNMFKDQIAVFRRKTEQLVSK